MHRFASPPHLPAIRGMDARDGLDHDRLAGTVVACQRGHLAGRDIQVDLRKCLNGTEVLADAAQA
jgi:hypothetical protein